MTGRSRLDRRLRWVYVAAYSAWSLIVAPVVAAQALGIPPGVPSTLPGGVLFVLVLMSAQYVVLRCPWCRGNLGGPLMSTGYWRVDPKVQYCPYCRCDLDRQLAAATRSDDAT